MSEIAVSHEFDRPNVSIDDVDRAMPLNEKLLVPREPIIIGSVPNPEGISISFVVNYTI